MSNLVCRFFLLFLMTTAVVAAQDLKEHVKILHPDDNNFSGLEILETEGSRMFFLGESRHALRLLPQATLKMFMYLHQNANVRVMGIEQGRSAAYLINKYLQDQDSLVLKQIGRSTMFWGKENEEFLKKLAAFYQSLPDDEKFRVESFDVEYKAESAILMLNILMEGKTSPAPLSATMGEFRRIFDESKTHREQFNGLNLHYYYDRDMVTALIEATLADHQDSPEKYRAFFEDDYQLFVRHMEDMRSGYVLFRYDKPDRNNRGRDQIMYDKMVELAEKYPDVGIMCNVGNQHLQPSWSGGLLRTREDSPLFNQVLIIQVITTQKGKIWDNGTSRINEEFGGALMDNDLTFIKNVPNNKFLRPPFKNNTYTIFISDERIFTPQENSYRGEE